MPWQAWKFDTKEIDDCVKTEVTLSFACRRVGFFARQGSIRKDDATFILAEVSDTIGEDKAQR